MRTTIQIRGARENNLRNIDVEIPRDKLVVVTGVSGSGKSSLAFDTIYAEGQRRLLASMSTFAKRFVGQLKKPDVDFVNGLSPVVSIDQKTVGSNPRSTVGTMTDISDYLRMLFATMGTPHCPLCGEALVDSHAPPDDGAPAVLAQGHGGRGAGPGLQDSRRGLRVPLRPHPGQRLPAGADRRQAARPGRPHRPRRGPGAHGRGRDRHVRRRPRHRPASRHVAGTRAEARRRACSAFTSSSRSSWAPSTRSSTTASAAPGIGSSPARCRPSSSRSTTPPAPARPVPGIGTAMRVHPSLLVPDPKRTLNEGAFVNAALSNSRDSWGGRLLYSLAAHYGFSLDVPYQELAEEHVQVLLYGTKGEQFEVLLAAGGETGAAARRQEDQVQRRHHATGASLPAIPQAGHVQRRHGRIPEEGDGRIRLPRMRRRPPEARPPTGDHRRPQPLRGRPDAPGRRARLPEIDPAHGPAAGDRRDDRARGDHAARTARRHRAGLPQPEPPVGDPLRRGIAADSAVVADRLGPHGDAVRARRTEHRAAPQGQRQDDRDAQAAARPGEHGDRRGARRRHDPGGGSRPRNRSRPGSPRRQGRGRGASEKDPARRQIAHGPVPQRQEGHQDPRPAAAGRAASRSSSAGPATTTSRTSASRSRSNSSFA